MVDVACTGGGTQKVFFSLYILGGGHEAGGSPRKFYDRPLIPPNPRRLEGRQGNDLYLLCSHNAKIYGEGKYLRVPI
jgi:hypothetical protein